MDNEEEKIKKIGKQTDEYITSTGQSKKLYQINIDGQPGGMAAKPGANPYPFRNPSMTSQNPPLPPNYICRRCNEKGHFIKFCPTNSNPEFDPITIKGPKN
jgi:hypothetical protein